VKSRGSGKVTAKYAYDTARRNVGVIQANADTSSAECGENADVVHSSKLRNLQNEVHRLTVLNAELLKQNSLISLKRLPNLDEGPGLQVLFMNNHVSRKYKADIEAYISKLVTRSYRAICLILGGVKSKEQTQLSIICRQHPGLH